MKRIQIKQEHKELIVSVIRENPRYKGNEELLDMFFESVYKKSYLLIDAIKDMPRLRRHLMTITESCIEQILKEKQRFDDAKSRQYQTNSIVSIKKENTDNVKKNLNNLKAQATAQHERAKSSDMIQDPITARPDKKVSQLTIEKLVQIVKNVSAKYPQKRYYEIFALRYIDGLNQTEIAQNMKISQVELSKRFVELIRLTRENI